MDTNTFWRKGGLALASGVICSLTLINAHAASSTTTYTPRVYPAGATLNVTDLPPSALRTKIESLPNTKAQNALNWLKSFTFTELDVPYLRVDPNGGIYVADTNMPPPPTVNPVNSLTNQLFTNPSTQALTSAETFSLHSKPGASNVIYLDFNGHTVTGTAWNTSYGITSWNATPFDADGIPSSFNTTELDTIASVWRRVAEDYAPFDVDVTTEDPVNLGPTVGRVLITPNKDSAGKLLPEGGTAAGVAYVGVWGYSYYPTSYSPAFVYSNIQYNRADFIAEAVSHEMGHNFGLSHDGTSTKGYYGGHGSGYVNWGPIMGTCYNMNVCQWSKGEYTDANNKQDDLGIISGKLTTRLDDHGNTAASATNLAVSATGVITTTTPQLDPANTNPSNKGIITSATDVDVFTFETSGGAITLNAMPAREAALSRGGNLDIHLVLTNSAGQTLAENDPLTDTNASISTTVSAGRYYLSVEGVGNTVTPYTDYASIGQYFISGNVPPGNSNTDITPDAFTFADQTNVARSSAIVSAPITITGINTAAPISITGGEYSINGGAYTATTGTVPNNGTITVRHTSSANYSTATNTTLAVGGVSDTFTSTTLAAPVQSTVTVSKIGSGTVTSDPAGINCGTDCNENYLQNSTVTLTATTDAGYAFTSWTGACTGTSPTCTLTLDTNKAVTANFFKVYNLSVTKTGNGTITSIPAGINCGTDCSEDVIANTNVTLTAAPASDSAFTGWSGACTGTASTCAVSMTAAKTVSATFKPIATLNVSKAGTGGGLVTSSPTGINCGTDCSENYIQGTSVTLTAKADTGSLFKGWSGACTGTSTCVVSMTEAKAVVATFDKITYELKTTLSGSGKVTSAPAGIDCGTDCAEIYNTSTSVVLTAVANAGSRFTGWSGSCTGTAATCTVSMTAAKAVTATFKPLYTLTVSETGAGKVTSAPVGIDCGADCSEDYLTGTNVTLTATADAGNKFTGWTGACTGSTTTCTVSMLAAKSVAATFKPLLAFTVSKNGTGGGLVTSSPTGINCGIDCDENYAQDTSITLIAKADTGSVFKGWSGACTGTTTCVVSLTEAKAVTATFDKITYELKATLSGDGKVTSAPAGIDCGTDCAEIYNTGTSVVLTAAANAGSRFVGWSGSCSGTAATCNVSMTAAKAVTATFKPLYTLTVSETGAGKVTSAPVGIDCGADCSEDYLTGTNVTLTATADAGNKFTGWTGACTGSTTTCTVSMLAAKSVAATFKPLLAFTVSKNGTGGGLVTSSPTGINCGIDCDENYAQDTSITLIAKADTGSVFKGWSGACTGTTTCVVSLTEAKAVTATFDKITYELKATLSGDGKVTSAPAGIDCGTDCAEIYDTGTSVVLTAAANAGSRFVGWSGSCSGTAATCNVSMTAAKAVTATFKPLYTLTVSETGAGKVTSAPVGIDCGADCSEDYLTGTNVTLTATADAGNKFTGWTGACTGSTTTCTVSMLAAKSVAATFKPLLAFTVSKNGTGGGLVTSSPTGINCGIDCDENYAQDTSITLIAKADTGSVFKGWSGACTGTTTCVVSLTEAKAVTATFDKITYELKATLSGSGKVTSAPAGIDCGTDCAEIYNTGTSVVLTAVANAGSRFTGWSGSCTGTAATCTVSMTAAKAVTATFKPLYTLTVSETGAGKVTSAPVGIDCGADCSEDYLTGTNVTLTATADAGNKFTGWTGACTGSTTTCTVSMLAAKSVAATFKPLLAFTVSKNGTGGGLVTSSPTGINCGIDCDENYAQDTSITLIAKADTGSVFKGWSGACTGTTTCVVSLTEAKAVTATFDKLTYELKATTVGSGKVTSVATGIDCGVDCVETYLPATSIVLTATADAGNVFTGWSGACTGTAPTCTVSMTSAKAVTATFKAAATLTVSKTGTGTGTVSSTTAGIACGTDCSENYLLGSTVSLSAKADTGSRFTGWSGACTGTSTTCTVSMSAAKTATATFTSP